MTKQQKEITNDTMTLFEAIMEGDKANLVDLGHMVGAKITKSMRKADMAKAVADHIISHPREFMEGLLLHELYVVSMICENEEGNAISGPMQMEQQSLYLLSVMEIVPTEEDDMTCYMLLPDDLRDALKPYVEEVITKKENDMNEVALTHAMLGMINIFGMLPLGLLTEYIGEDEKLTSKQAIHFLHSHYLFELNTLTDPDDEKLSVLMSPFFDFDQSDKFFDESKKNKDLQLKVDFPAEEFARWGEMPFPVQHVKIAQPLIKVVRKYIGNEGVALSLVTLFWHDCQLAPNPTQAIFNLLNLLGLDSEKAINEVMQALVTFANNMPRWIFKGYSSNEMEKKKDGKPERLQATAIPISMGMPFGHPMSGFDSHHAGFDPHHAGLGFGGNDFDDEEIDDEFEEMLYEGIDPRTGRRIRPNDPCPCGSGLKYKKCHGQRPN